MYHFVFNMNINISIQLNAQIALYIYSAQSLKVIRLIIVSPWNRERNLTSGTLSSVCIFQRHRLKSQWLRFEPWKKKCTQKRKENAFFDYTVQSRQFDSLGCTKCIPWKSQANEIHSISFENLFCFCMFRVPSIFVCAWTFLPSIMSIPLICVIS